MPALDIVNNNAATETPEESSSAPINPVVGIIYPPPEVRNIVDKTASFVARNGPEFEARIRQNELGNPKFNFLNPGDPYHAYYQHKVNDFREGKGQEPAAGLPSAISKLTVSASAQQKQQEILKAVEQPFVPKDPPTDFEFIADPPSISALDLDIVKLTAQFVARNGRQFLTQLMNREQRNFQFDFLRPQHSLFQYFTKLLEQYTKVLIPPKSMQQRLRDEAKSAPAVLDQVKYRAEWHKYQEAQKAKEEEVLERERVAYAQIDWHDFVVVETVDYQQFEIGNFPPPTTPEEVGARLLIQERMEEGEDIEMQLESDDEEDTSARNNDEGLSRMEDRTGHRKTAEGRDDNRVQDMEEESSDEEGGSESRSNPIQPPLPPVPDKVLVKKYDPKQAPKVTRPSVGDDYLISPITREKIPASKVQEHMRIGLLDPRWVEQRDKQVTDKMNQDTVYAAGSAIDASLKKLAERRTDIFGVGDEETAIGKKIGEEDVRKDEKVTWDGHTSSVEAATRAARANITLEEQIHQIHKVKGLLPDEEKEKIGPKNVVSKAVAAKAAAVISAKPQSNPNPTPVKPPQSVATQQPQISLAMPPQPILSSQPPIMMMPAPPMPPMRPPPPLMMPAPPQMAGFVTPMPPHMAGMGMKHPMDGGGEEEPSNKKMRNEDSLIPEEVFLARNANPVTLKVSIPMQPEKSEWKLAGQVLTFTMPLSESVANLKAKVQDDTSMPPAKQKLFYDGMFFKDSNTLAYYNITTGAVIQLQIKERGGRKK